MFWFDDCPFDEVIVVSNVSGKRASIPAVPIAQQILLKPWELKELTVLSFTRDNTLMKASTSLYPTVANAHSVFAITWLFGGRLWDESAIEISWNNS